MLPWIGADVPDFADPATARAFAAADARTPLPLNRACKRALNAETGAWDEDEERTRWGAVGCPVWVVHGEGDPRPADGPRALAGLLPRARSHKVPGAGHQLWRERPDAVARILADVAAHAALPG